MNKRKKIFFSSWSSICLIANDLELGVLLSHFTERYFWRFFFSFQENSNSLQFHFTNLIFLLNFEVYCNYLLKIFAFQNNIQFKKIKQLTNEISRKIIPIAPAELSADDGAECEISGWGRLYAVILIIIYTFFLISLAFVLDSSKDQCQQFYR